MMEKDHSTRKIIIHYTEKEIIKRNETSGEIIYNYVVWT